MGVKERTFHENIFNDHSTANQASKWVRRAAHQKLTCFDNLKNYFHENNQSCKYTQSTVDKYQKDFRSNFNRNEYVPYLDAVSSSPQSIHGPHAYMQLPLTFALHSF